MGKEVESGRAAPGLPHAKGSNIWMSRGSFVSQNAGSIVVPDAVLSSRST